MLAGERPLGEGTTRDGLVGKRRRFFSQFADFGVLNGLEIGACDLPVVPADSGRCLYADTRTEVQLVLDLEVEDLTKAVRTDLVVSAQFSLREQIPDRFDYVILCHVLEHIINPIAFLCDLCFVLKPGGYLFLALPDKRRTPDSVRPSTTSDEILGRFFSGATSPSLGLMAEYSRAWSSSQAQAIDEDPREFFTFLATRLEQSAPDDIHCNVWEDYELFEQLKYFSEVGLLEGLSVVDVLPNEPDSNEFYITLRKRYDAEFVPAAATETQQIGYRSCNACGGGSFDLFRRIHDVFPEYLYPSNLYEDESLARSLNLQYLTCRTCDLTGINPIPLPDIVDVRAIQEESGLDLGSPAVIESLELDGNQRTEILYEQAEIEKYRSLGRILDVSCGPGVSLAWLRKFRDWEVVGVDPSLPFTQFAREHYGLEVHDGLVQDLQLEDESFDVIMATNSLGFHFDPAAAILRIADLLRPGGLFVVQCPNRDGLSTQNLDSNVNWGQWFLFSPRSLARSMRDADLIPQRLVAIQSPPDPRLGDIGFEIDPEAPELHVWIDGAEELEADLAVKNAWADFFLMTATRAAHSEADPDLRKRIALASKASRSLRRGVAITPGSDPPYRDRVRPPRR